jgi:5'-nucleotidase
MLTTPLPFDTDLLKLDVPSDATPETPWRLTRVSRHPYFISVSPQRRDFSEPVRIDYDPLVNPESTEPDSDIHALAVDRVVSIAPMSVDLTSRVDRYEMEALLFGPATR